MKQGQNKTYAILFAHPNDGGTWIAKKWNDATLTREDIKDYMDECRQDGLTREPFYDALHELYDLWESSSQDMEDIFELVGEADAQLFAYLSHS